MGDAHIFGRKAETAAQDFVKSLGYRILETNWRIYHFEIDIIAMDGNELVIIEVKARKTAEYGHPSEFISRKKERNLIEATEHYILEKGLQNEVRFDVITLLPAENGFEIEHFRDAFNAYS